MTEAKESFNWKCMQSDLLTLPSWMRAMHVFTFNKKLNNEIYWVNLIVCPCNYIPYVENGWKWPFILSLIDSLFPSTRNFMASLCCKSIQFVGIIVIVLYNRFRSAFMTERKMIACKTKVKHKWLTTKFRCRYWKSFNFWSGHYWNFSNNRSKSPAAFYAIKRLPSHVINTVIDNYIEFIVENCHFNKGFLRRKETSLNSN